MRKHTVKRGKILLWLSCIFCVAAVFVLLWGCTEKEVILSLGETAEVDGLCEITPENILVSPQVYAPVAKGSREGYEAGEDRTFVIISTRIKNISEEKLDLRKVCDCRLQPGDEENSRTMILTLEKGQTALGTSAQFAAGESKEVYFVMETEKEGAESVSDSEEEEERTLAAFDFHEDEEEDWAYNYKLAVDTSEPVASSEPLQLNKTIVCEGLAELTPVKVRLAEKLEPENPGYYYNYFKGAEKGDKLLVLDLDVKNLSGQKKRVDTFYGIRVVGADGESYVGGAAAEDRDRANLLDSITFAKNSRNRAYAAVSLPKTARQGICDIYLYVGGTYYLYRFEK